MLGKRASRYVGTLLGSAFGDILGASVEGMGRDEILQAYGVVRDFIDTGRGLGRYTDDTQMTMSLATSLLRSGGVDEADCARACAEFFEPQRGYGRSAVRILEALRRGADYKRTGTMLFAEGSFGNGAAMRIAPLGLVCASAAAEGLREKVYSAVRSTHVHPEAIDGALVQAMAVGRLTLARQGELPEAEGFLGLLRGACTDANMVRGLQVVEVLLRSSAGDEEAAERLGTGVRSSESVSAALWTALRYGNDPEEAIVRAVNLGGDTDTVGAMCGALVGALHGDGWFPTRWFNGMENGDLGRDALIGLAEELAEELALRKACK